MNKDNIVFLPHTNLREKSQKVTNFGDELQALIDDMTAASIDWENAREHELCVGLAAVQVDILQRVVILRDDEDQKEEPTFTPLINPKLIRGSGKAVLDYEGCLSVKNLYGLVPRYPKIKIKAQDRNGAEVRITAEGQLARLIQHEIDHTNGILYVDHIKHDDNFYAINEDTGKIEKLDYEAHIKNSKDLWG